MSTYVVRFRLWVLAVFATVAWLVVVAPPKASASSCGDNGCGVPSCQEPAVRARPGMSRELSVQCSYVRSATLKTPPAHGEISDVSTDYYGLRFTFRPDDGAPRSDSAVFHLTGPEGGRDVSVSIDNVPLSQNSAPVCTGDQVTQRSDGTGPVDVTLHPYCYDPDDDDFVVTGAGPGVHTSAPDHVLAGWSESNWFYRTATFSGTETATIAATDALGARSADAQLVVTVGPGVDRAATCQPNPMIGDGSATYPIYARPGATRRFGLYCDDPDGDAFSTRISTPPGHGVIALYADGPEYDSPYWGAQRWVTGTYVPADGGLQPDPFGVTATTASGDAPESQMKIVPLPLPANHGGGCGWSPPSGPPDVPQLIAMQCDDDDGDSLHATVVTHALHGTDGPVAVTDAPYGQQQITIPYVPDPGYTGYDCVKVSISDGHGMQLPITVDIWITSPPPPAPPDPPGVPPVPVPAPVPPPPPGPPAVAPTPPMAQLGPPPRAVAPAVLAQPSASNARRVRSVAQEALGTKAVTRVAFRGGAEVWAARSLVKGELLQRGEVPALVVVCRVACHIRSDTTLGAHARASRRQAAQAATAGQPRVVYVALDPRERAWLRRTRPARATVTLSIRSGSGPVRSLRRRIAIAP